MIISEELKNYLNKSASFNNSIILITNTSEIIYNSNIEENIGKLPDNISNTLFDMYKENEVVKVYNSYKVKIIDDPYLNIKNEVIMLILDNDKVVGSLFLLNHNLNFEVSNFTFSSSILNTLKTMLKLD